MSEKLVFVIRLSDYVCPNVLFRKASNHVNNNLKIGVGWQRCKQYFKFYYILNREICHMNFKSRLMIRRNTNCINETYLVKFPDPDTTQLDILDYHVANVSQSSLETNPNGIV